MNRSITGFLGGLIFLGLFVGTAQATVVDSLRVELASSRTDTQRMRLHFALMSAQTYAAADTLVAACQAARSVAMRLGQSKDIGRTWYLEGWALNRKGSFAASIQASEQAGHFFAEAGELKQQTKAMVNLSNSYRQMGNPHKAKEMLEGMLEKVEKEKDTLLVATVRNNIAILHAQEGEFALAATYFASCLNDFQQVGDSLEVANAANNLGNVNLKLRNYTQAVDWYIRAARIDEELKNFRGLAGDYNNISHIYLEIGDPKQALTYSNSSFAAYQQIGNVRGMVMSL
ncbi:MAG TPA: tetratricopeptide repeat protein, partial [Bacteroidetes bacterium]|nr:tetratricopeptide repeat protein [Bacteroidota bacterium]